MAAQPWYNEERVAQKGSVILTEFASRQKAARERAAMGANNGAQQRAFAAAQLNRLTAGWRVTQEKIDDELRNDLDALRNRSRTLENNNDFARKYFDMVETNIIGDEAPRLVPLADNAPGSPDDGARRAIAASWAEWCQVGNCEISGQYAFTDLCQNIARGTARDGEYLIMPIRGAKAGNRWNFALQVLDVDRIATWKNQESANGQNAIVAGVEVNDLGRPVAYWFNTGPLKASGRQAEQIPAGTVLHRFKITRPEQKRGIPWMHASMLSMHYAGEFALSALMAAKHGSDHLGFFISPDGSPPKIGDDDDDDGDQKFMTSAPGTYDTLPVGYDIKTVESKYPNEVFGPFVKSAYQRMASGLPGASYPELCNDYEAVNFSSIRAAVLSSRDEWKKLHKWFAKSWLDPIFADWLRFSLSSGAIVLDNGSPLPVAKIDKFKAHTWQFRGWGWVDPLKDIETAQKAIALGISSRTRVAREMGRDIEDIFDELQQESALAAKYDIQLTAPDQSQGQPAQTPENP